MSFKMLNMVIVGAALIISSSAFAVEYSCTFYKQGSKNGDKDYGSGYSGVRIFSVDANDAECGTGNKRLSGGLFAFQLSHNGQMMATWGNDVSESNKGGYFEVKVFNISTLGVDACETFMEVTLSGDGKYYGVPLASFGGSSVGMNTGSGVSDSSSTDAWLNSYDGTSEFSCERL